MHDSLSEIDVYNANLDYLHFERVYLMAMIQNGINLGSCFCQLTNSNPKLFHYGSKSLGLLE